MPSHSHGYQKFCLGGYCMLKVTSYDCDYYPYNKTPNFLERTSTDSEGGGKAHNNMPPYLTVNCWRRTG